MVMDLKKGADSTIFVYVNFNTKRLLIDYQKKHYLKSQAKAITQIINDHCGDGLSGRGQGE